MIIAKLKGGHSNQMFQYAAARRLALKRQTKLYLDLDWYADTSKYDSPRVYELGSYNIEENFLKPRLLNRWLPALGLVQTYNEAKRQAGQETRVLGPHTFHLGFDKSVLELGPNTYLDADFQCEKYFADIRSTLLKDFSHKKPPSAANQKVLDMITSDPNATSLHVRRGDYVHTKNVSSIYRTLELDYYQAALARLKKTVKKPSLYIISNDPAWCRENLRLDAPMYVVDNNDDLTGGAEDMRLMRACKHNIMANSTFSWWGAWLNENPDKIVIAPKQWFNKADVQAGDLLPESWLSI